MRSGWRILRWCDCLALSAVVTAPSMSANAFAADIQTRQVSFENEGTTLAGTLYLPANFRPGEKRPQRACHRCLDVDQGADVGPLCFREMAERGFVALAFDFRGWGQSGGEYPLQGRPDRQDRRYFGRRRRPASLPEIDASRIAGLGQLSIGRLYGGGRDLERPFPERVAGRPWLHNGGIVEQVYGGKDGVDRLIALSRRAEEAERNGTPQLITAASMTDETALMYQILYYTETGRGLIREI